MSDVCAHYETGEYRRNATFLEDEEYGRALDCFVKGCADALLQDEETGELLLLQRTSHPQPDWWYLGGRMRAGDTPLQAIVKNTRRETGLDLPPDRFDQVCTVSMLWQKRKQEPEDNGTADISVVFVARVTPSERAAVTVDSREHRAVKWVAPEEVLGGEHYHPALRRGVQHMLLQEAYRKLEAAVAARAGDAKVAAAAAAYMTQQLAAKRLSRAPVPPQGGAAAQQPAQP